MDWSNQELTLPSWRAVVTTALVAIGSVVVAAWVGASTSGAIWSYLENDQHYGCYLSDAGESTGDWICGDGMSKVLPQTAATAALAVAVFLLSMFVRFLVRRVRR